MVKRTHAWQLRAAHPHTGDIMHIDAPPPADLTAAAASLIGCDEADVGGWLAARAEVMFGETLKGFAF